MRLGKIWRYYKLLAHCQSHVYTNPMEKKECDLLIIGGGPAGLTAAIYGARAGLKTIVLEKLGVGGQIMTTADIENFPGFASISGPDLAMKLYEQAEGCGVEFVYDEIQKFDFNNSKENPQGSVKTVECSETTITSRAIILSVGAYPRKTGAENEDKFIGRGVHFCGLCDGAFYRDKDIVVVGGGNSAVEEAIYMSDIAKSIIIINATASFNAQDVLVKKLETLSNVAVKHNNTLKSIHGDKKVSSVDLNSGQNIKCEGVFVAIGRVPNTGWLSGYLDLDKSGYIIADDKMQTSVAGVYAGGDCIQKHVRQIITACADGAIAATHAAEYIKNLIK